VRLHGNLRRSTSAAHAGRHDLLHERSPPSAPSRSSRKRRCDFGFSFEKKARFRVAVYIAEGPVRIALRLIPNKLLSSTRSPPALDEEPALPPARPRPRDGPTGSGKTTTLATMIDFINIENDCHIITVEDPIESTTSTRSRSSPSVRWASTSARSPRPIRRGLRMDRTSSSSAKCGTLETIQTRSRRPKRATWCSARCTRRAPRAPSTAWSTPSVEQQEQIRAQLSTALLAVISQALLPKAEGSGVVAGVRDHDHHGRIAHNIRENQTHKITSSIQTGAQQGMILLTTSSTTGSARSPHVCSDLLLENSVVEEVASRISLLGARLIERDLVRLFPRMLCDEWRP